VVAKVLDDETNVLIIAPGTTPGYRTGIQAEAERFVPAKGKAPDFDPRPYGMRGVHPPFRLIPNGKTPE
jgi:hypothetical protein